ncbi:MAG: preprotein translocase subunit SecG [Phycisphaerales bacterium]|nr:MAG: preprotein translocase subunit SecG [Phycisphaerales bacterium]
MTSFPVLAISLVGLLLKFMAFLFGLTCLVLILLILVQKGKGGGLSAAFGGAMAGGLLGSKTGDFLTWVTIVLVGIFLGLGVLMAKFYRPALRFGDEPPSEQRQPADVGPNSTAGQGEPETGAAGGVGEVNVPAG